MTIIKRYANKKFINLHLILYDFGKCIIVLFLLIIIPGCGQSNTKIEGTWTYIKSIENGKEIVSPEKAGHRQFQYLENGELKLFNDNNRIGLRLYYYKLKGDSLYLLNVQVDTTDKVDTLGIQTGLVSIRNDTMNIRRDNKIYYYKREN